MARKSKKRGKWKKKKKFKLKTHKATAKRFKMTGGGKLMRTKGDQGHLRRNKSKRARRKFVKMQEIKGSKYKKTLKRIAPYIGRYKIKGR